MRRLVSTPKFDRAYARYTKRDAARRKCVDETLARLEGNPNDPRLKMHRLSGHLAGQFACSCGYDCRICSSGIATLTMKPSFSSTSARTTKCIDGPADFLHNPRAPDP